jgi:hypothetical protein
MNGKAYSLKPDLITQVPLGRSFSVFSGHNRLGFIGQSSTGPGMLFGGGLSPQMGTAMGSALKSQGIL